MCDPVHMCMCNIMRMWLCRQQQRLKQHDLKRDELERKEKAFMLYVNGANAAVALPTSSKTARTARRHKAIADRKPHY